jgi:hypothetical protein
MLDARSTTVTWLPVVSFRPLAGPRALPNWPQTNLMAMGASKYS